MSLELTHNDNTTNMRLHVFMSMYVCAKFTNFPTNVTHSNFSDLRLVTASEKGLNSERDFSVQCSCVYQLLSVRTVIVSSVELQLGSALS